MKNGSEIVTLEDRLDERYVRHVHLMSSAPVVYDAPGHALVETGIDAGMHWLRASWLWREPAPLIEYADGSVRWCVLWGLKAGERISEAVFEAGYLYLRQFHVLPEYAWVRTMPKGVDLGAEIAVGSHTMGLFDMAFLPPGFVAVGR